MESVKDFVKNNRVGFRGAAFEFFRTEKIKGVLVETVEMIWVDQMVLRQGGIWQTHQKAAAMPEYPVNFRERKKIIRDMFQSMIRKNQFNAIGVKWKPVPAQIQLYIRFIGYVDIDETGNISLAGPDV